MRLLLSAALLALSAANAQAADIRHDGMAAVIFTISPSFRTNATSMGNFMKKVWIALVGAMTIACRSGNDV